MRHFGCSLIVQCLAGWPGWLAVERRCVLTLVCSLFTVQPPGWNVVLQWRNVQQVIAGTEDTAEPLTQGVSEKFL